jgi:CheY-like chemotaxis protein
MVLIVEDEPLVRDLGQEALQSLGYEVITAGDGLEGVESYRRHHAGLRAVLLDLKMPRMGGLEAFMEMQQISTGVPVIICTGYGENEEVQKLLTLGAKGMLSKPYRIADLARTLGDTVGWTEATSNG